ncbi:endonuclease domain-containing protein [Bradyrhizobium sp. SZCCHNRI2049]|uniref:endonuclease domain-containing protein n=1 Tax=Bradyrhizobium sp. SZCCHNRI2049 TaxID=3057287 RepID=UPI00396790A0
MVSRCRDYRRRYGITLKERDALIAAHPFCAICNTPFDMRHPRSSAAPTIDHCHTTLRVRGVLCQLCNRGLGNFKDNPASLRAALAYLRRTNGRRTTRNV